MDHITPANVGIAVASIIVVAGITRYLRDPLRHVPGPFIARLTPAWLWYISWTGVECTVLDALHKKHGPVIRIAPNDVDISDGAAVVPIYIKNGGFPKTPNYRNVDVNGFATIFSVLDSAHRAVRTKAVAPLFAQQAVSKGRPAVKQVVDDMVEEMKRRKAEASGGPIDVLNLFRATFIDSVACYLLGKSFGGVSQSRLSATDFIDAFASGGRFFLLPGWIFHHVDNWAAKWHSNKDAIEKSTDHVQRWAAELVDESIRDEKQPRQTYQGRLLDAGVSREEVISQVVDILFAGTDAASRTLTVLAENVGSQPHIYERVHQEVLGNPDIDAQSLPYLSAVVKESLRLSLANPVRLPRLVPKGGLQIPGWPYIPEGTSVGCGAYSLHLNPDVFPRPYDFFPERWLNVTSEMLRDSFAFGNGSRQCIARSFAYAMVTWAAEGLIRSDVLRGAKPAGPDPKFLYWFNIVVRDGQNMVKWE